MPNPTVEVRYRGQRKRYAWLGTPELEVKPGDSRDLLNEILTYAAHPALNPAEPPCTDPYARWCDRESE